MPGRERDGTLGQWIAGKRVIVTGATSGIGRQIAVELGARGARLVLPCRNVERGAVVAAEIARRSHADAPAVMPFDASSQQSIRAFAAAYRAQHGRLDVLVNNAGMAHERRLESVDGIEMTFATNVLGYYLLTRELLPALDAGAPSRIVVVASTFASDLDLSDLQYLRRPYDGLRAYAQSKACNRLLTWALARRLRDRGVTANAMAPGFVPGTDLSRHLAPDVRKAYKERTGRSVAQGADTAIWLASSQEVDGISGKLFYDRQEIPCQFRDDRLEDELWAACEQMT